VIQVFGWLVPDSALRLDEADALLARALPLDRSDAFAHHVMSRVAAHAGAHRGGDCRERDVARAHPNLVDALAWSGPL